VAHLDARLMDRLRENVKCGIADPADRPERKTSIIVSLEKIEEFWMFHGSKRPFFQSRPMDDHRWGGAT